MVFFIERVNLEVAKLLRELSLKQLQELYNASKNKRSDIEDEETNFKTEQTKLINYCNAVLQSENNYKVEYGYVAGKDFGRIQSKQISLQRIFNGFRGLLCENISYDLDMKNAHPTILKYLCNKHEIEYIYLDKYIKNRDEWLNELMIELKIEKPDAKALYLKCVNKETYTSYHRTKKIKNNNFLNFDKEMKEIQNKIWDLYKDELYKYVKNETNQKGKLINLVLCKYENDCLQEAIKIMEDKKIEIQTPMFDGCTIYKSKYNVDDIISILNKNFKNIDNQRVNIEWTLKPHNLELKELLYSFKIKKVDRYEGKNIIEIVNHMLNTILKDKLKKDKDNLYLMIKDKILMNEKAIDMQLYDLISDQEYYIIEEITTKEGIEYTYKEVSKIHKSIIEIIAGLKAKCETDNNFKDTIWNRTLNRIYFKNGYYDFKDKKFVEGEHNDTFIKIDKDLDMKSNEKIRKDLLDKVIYPVFSIDYKNINIDNITKYIDKDNKDKDKDKINKDENQYLLMKYFLYRISRILAGHIEDKQWVLLQGLRNCGKGVLSDILKKAFDGYIRTTNAGNFILKTSTQDASKAQSWILDYEFVRLAITQEISLEEKQYIDGNMIKKFCSGGDYIDGRKNHKDEVEFKIQSSLMICCNDFDKVKPSDAMELCNEFQMKSKFIDDTFDNSLKLEGYKYYTKDNNLKTEFLSRKDIINEFILLIIEAYNTKADYPKDILQQNKENDEDDDYNKLFNIFEFTTDTNNFISNNDLKDILKNYKIPFTVKKSKMLLKTKGAEEHRNASDRGLCFIKEK